MKTLVISVDYPLPENKGNRMRTMHFVRFFKGRGDVDLMCYKSHAPRESCKASFRKEYYIDFKANANDNRNKVLRTLQDKFIERKPWIVNNFSAETVKDIHNVIVKEDYDVILCRYAVNAYPLLSLPEKYRKRVILDMDDIMSDDLYNALNGDRFGLEQIKYYIDKIIYKMYQVKCINLGKVLLCSKSDQLKMAKYKKNSEIYVVPNIVPQEDIPPTYDKKGHDKQYLFFVGTLSYQPNEMGIIWFIDEIYNKLPEQYRDLKLLIAGKDPCERLKKVCADNDRIELIANPPDMIPYFEKCFAVVVPVLIGGGTRIKILEAGNCYRPVISTRLGAYGLDLKDFESILYFSEINSFISKLSWLQDKDNYYSVVDRLAGEIRTQYTETNFAHSLSTVVDAL